MKSLEIFLDESGDITRERPMNISGIAVLAPSEQARDAFHADFFRTLLAEGLTSGICDNAADNGKGADELSDSVQAPAQFLPKRPDDGAWAAFWDTLWRVAEMADQTAKNHKTDVLAFSLQFPATSARRWCADDPASDLLLDRPYGECIKDVLELLLFETPCIRRAIENQGGCLLGIDLPTRTLGTSVETEVQQPAITRMWSQWGVQAWPDWAPDTRQPQVVANTLEPSDGIEILTSTLNRRKGELGGMKVERARCCKLTNWSQWVAWDALQDAKRRSKRYWVFKNSPRPKQIHYLADYLANGIFNGQVRANQDPYRKWYDRGFLLSSVDERADSWITAVRAFANGNRIEAMLEAGRICAAPQHCETKTFQFFRRSARGWLAGVAGSDLRELFHRIGKGMTEPGGPCHETDD